MKYTPVVFGRNENGGEIPQPNENLFVPKRRCLEKRKTEGIEGRPEEKDQDDQHLRCDQKIGKPTIFKNALFHKKRGRGGKDSSLPIGRQVGLLESYSLRSMVLLSHSQFLFIHRCKFL